MSLWAFLMSQLPPLVTIGGSNFNLIKMNQMRSLKMTAKMTMKRMKKRKKRRKR